MNRLWIILFLVFSLSATAQSPLINKTELNYNDLNYKIKRISINNQGYLYLVTDRGVLYFDGYKYFDVEIPAKFNNNINTIFFDKRNELWVGDVNGNVYHKSTKSAKAFHLASPISDIIQDNKGTIWISTYGSGIAYVEKDSLYQYSRIAKLADNYLYDLELINDEIWLASDQGIGIIHTKTKKYNPFKLNKDIADDIISALKYDTKFNLLYIGTQSRGLFRYRSRENYVESIDGSDRIGCVNKIALNHNEVWLLSEDSGLVHYSHEGHFKAFNKKNKEFVSSVSDIQIDNEGNIWLCNQTSLLYNFNDLFELLKYPSHFTNVNCAAIYRDDQALIWVSFQNKLYCYKNKKFEEILSEIKNLNVISIHKDEFGWMWFGTFDKGVIRYHPQTKKYRVYDERDGIANNNVLSVTSKNNSLWLATLGGVSKVSFTNKLENLKSVSNFSKESGLGINFIYQVFIDSKNRVWFATDGKGVTVYDGFRFVNYNNRLGLRSKTIYSIVEDAHGVLWLNSAKDGIYSFDGTKFINFNRAKGIRYYDNAGIVNDNNNNLLIVNNNGIDIFNTSTHQILYHDEELGLKELNPGLNANFKDEYGNIWVGTSKGIIKYYSHLNTMWEGPHTILKKVRVYYESRKDSLPQHFKYNENYLTFDYIGLWYHKPSEVKYKIQLVGYDLKWYETRDNSVTYSKLPPGKYTFQVMSSATNDFSNAKIVSYKFEIKSPFWTQFWFIFLSAIGVIICLYYLLKWRENQLKVKENYEKDRIAFQLDTLRNQINPHFLFNSFNALIGIIETDQDKAVLFVEKMSDFYRELLFYREKSLITIEEEVRLLMNYIFLLEQRFGNKIIFNITISNDDLKKMIAPLSLQLLVENAIKHNMATRENPLVVDVYCDEKYIIVKNVIQRKRDDVVSMGIGLLNIKNRYQILSNDTVIVDENEQFFIVKIPLIK